MSIPALYVTGDTRDPLKTKLNAGVRLVSTFVSPTLTVPGTATVVRVVLDFSAVGSFSSTDYSAVLTTNVSGAYVLNELSYKTDTHASWLVAVPLSTTSMICNLEMAGPGWTGLINGDGTSGPFTGTWATPVAVAIGQAGAAGANGTNGTNGTPGSQMLLGSGAEPPSVGSGVNGDYTFYSATGNLYQKASGAWALLVSLAGSLIRIASGVPSNSLGNNGDLYIDSGSATDNLYQRVTGVYTLVGGLKGAALRYGSGVPSNSLGIDGDSYVNTSTGDYYARAVGTYSLQFNATGPAGPTGTTGGTASGDLGGSYPNPTVAGLQGHPVSTTTPIDGQVLAYSASAVKWQPQSGVTGTFSFYVSPGLGMAANQQITMVFNQGVLTSEYSSAVAVPGAVNGLTGTAGVSSASLTWATPTGRVVTYSIERSTTNGGPYTTIGTVSVGTNSYTDSTVTNGTIYYYVVAANNESGAGGNSNQVTLTPAAAPAAPVITATLM